MEDNNAFDRQSPPIGKYFIDDLTGGQACSSFTSAYLATITTAKGWAAIARHGGR
jgi:hypothetical protein